VGEGEHFPAFRTGLGEGEAEPVGKADRHSRSTKILSMQRPLPSMLIVTPPRSRTPVKSVLVNWLPDPC
jgi:hypothetical protein